jgi:hypothetical protein
MRPRPVWTAMLSVAGAAGGVAARRHLGAKIEALIAKGSLLTEFPTGRI